MQAGQVTGQTLQLTSEQLRLQNDHECLGMQKLRQITTRQRVKEMQVTQTA